MNTLLVHKGISTQDEFQKFFVEWTKKKRTEEGPRGASRSEPEFS